MTENCEAYIGEWNEAEGFFGANCGTWMGGFGANCRTVEAQAKAQRDQCKRTKYAYKKNSELFDQAFEVAKYGAAVVLAFFIIKWYLKS